MAKNTGKGHRAGFVNDRSQTYNAKTGQYLKRDKTTGRFISASNNKYKGVKEEKKSNANKR